MVLRPEAKSADHEAIGGAVIAHCRARVAGYKVPRDLVILDELPRTSTGKVRKNRSTGKVRKNSLREQAWADKEAHIN